MRKWVSEISWFAMVCHLNRKSLEGELSIGDEVNLMDQSSGDELSIGQ